MNVLLHIATLVVLICSVGSINICSHGAYINTDRQTEVATTSKQAPSTPFHQDALINTAPVSNLPGIRTPRCYIPNAGSQGRSHIDSDATRILNIIRHCSLHATLQCTKQATMHVASPRRYYVITLRRILC